MHNKLFPVCIIDDFYHNSYDVRKFALSQKFYPNEDNRWPGARTKPINEINKNLFHHFCDKLIGIFYNIDDILHYNISTYFQKIKPFHSEKLNKNNRGFIHQDQVLFGGVVYLDLISEERTGTSIYTPKNQWWYRNKLDGDVNRLKYKKYGGESLIDEDMLIWDQSREQYLESIKVENVFNRCILFDGNNHHGVPYFGTEERLTQVFFVNNLVLSENANTRYPLLGKGIG